MRRLRFDQPLEDLLIQAKARRAAAKEAPLLLSLEWLDATRGALLGAEQAKAWAPDRLEAFIAACARLAAETKPEYLEVAPEVNVYLARLPQEAATVLQLVHRVRKAVRMVSPGTKVLVSLNVEVLAGLYGKGAFRPFGELPRPAGVTADLTPVLAEADAVGLTSHPQSAFRDLTAVRGDYLLALREALPRKPLLVTRMSMRVPEQRTMHQEEHLGYLRRLLQLCYWLDASLVVYPEVVPERSTGPFAEEVRNPDRPALGHWNDVLAFRRVDRLSAAPPRPEDGEEKAATPEGDPPRPPGGPR